MKEIELGGKYGKCKFALVDDEDYNRLSQYKWTAVKRPNDQFYAVRSIQIDKGKRVIILLHRDVLDVVGKKCTIDHRDHNGLNNQKENLRICNTSENLGNRRNSASLNITSKYKGVHWFKRNSKWHAQIMVNYKHIHLGYFTNEKDAALAYNRAAIKYFGEYAYLNIIEDLL